jgi:hypothetical protein
MIWQVAAGTPEGDMSLHDAIGKVTAGLETPLTARQRRFLQWHIETEFGGDYAEDAQNLSFFHYDGGKAGEYRHVCRGSIHQSSAPQQAESREHERCDERDGRCALGDGRCARTDDRCAVGGL